MRRGGSGFRRWRNRTPSERTLVSSCPGALSETLRTTRADRERISTCKAATYSIEAFRLFAAWRWVAWPVVSYHIVTWFLIGLSRSKPLNWVKKAQLGLRYCVAWNESLRGWLLAFLLTRTELLYLYNVSVLWSVINSILCLSHFK